MTPDEMNPNICPSALEEDGTLDRTKWDGTHVWSEAESDESILAFLRVAIKKERTGTDEAESIADTLRGMFGLVTQCNECGTAKN